MLNGTYPENNEVALTDYMADVFIQLEVFPGKTNIDDLINKKFTLINTNVKISGIIKTDINKYASYKNSNVIPRELISNMTRGNYSQLYMTQQTYDQINSTNNLSIYFVINDTSDYFFGNASTFNDNYNDQLLGKLPENDNEIVLTLSSMINELYYSIDESDNSKIESYLGRNYSLTFSGENQKTYTLVGIINDSNNLDVPFSIMFSKDEYSRLTNFEINNQAITVLSNNSKENTKFLSELKKLGYYHNTYYSNNIYSLQETIDKLMLIFYIIGGVFLIFGIVLIFTFMSFSINEKQREIGTLRAIGAKGLDVGKIFITEGIIIGLLSSFLASISIIVISRMLNDTIIDNFRLKLVILYLNPYSILFTVITALIMVLISTYAPIKRITSMKPINAIKALK